MPKKQRSLTSTAIEVAIHNDIRFPKTNPGADYHSVWSSNSTACDLYRIIRSWESAILFAAREGWVNSIAPRCKHNLCQGKNTTSYLYKRKECNWVWRFRCCRTMTTILKGSMFYNSSYGPGKLLEIMWMMSMRAPINMMSYTVFGRLTSEISA